jgi:phage/plasmid-associated DNA primase
MRSTNSALQFLNDTNIVEPDPNGRVKGTELYKAYVKWCSERGIRPMGRNNFYSVVASKYHEYQREGATWFRGLRLKSSDAGEAGLDKYMI